MSETPTKLIPTAKPDAETSQDFPENSDNLIAARANKKQSAE